VNEPAPPVLGGLLDPELRRDVEAVCQSVPVDGAGGASPLKFSLVENGISRWSAGGANEFAVPRVHKAAGNGE
jgi:hypothetical protein